VPFAPKSACPVCRKTNCADPTHSVRYLDAHRPKRRVDTWAERKAKAQAVAEWRDLHGDWCPGYDRPSHPAADLTADHIVPVSKGGDLMGPFVVLCRSCNARKGNK
jgi:5-methylcytosine-specific restriction enzyme A